MLLDRLDLCPAVGARILVRLQVEIAHADRGLDVPVLAHGPIVTVAHADTRAPTLVTLVLGPQPVDIGDVVNQIRDMQPQEMPEEALAEPITHLRMQPEMLDGLVETSIVVLPVEGIQTYLGLQRPFRSQPKFVFKATTGGFPPSPTRDCA